MTNPSAASVSLSPQLRLMQAHSQLLTTTARALNVPPGQPQTPTQLRVANAPRSDRAGRELGQDLVAQVIGPAFDEFLGEHPKLTRDELEKFRNETRAALTTGMHDAREFLRQFGDVTKDTEEQLALAEEHANAEIDTFVARFVSSATDS